jgi:cobalt-zinc-cadmium efflux system protein
MAHSHSHSQTHTHHHEYNNEQRTLWAALLTGGFMFAEIIGGLAAGSLALLADAAHMLTDASSLALAYFAFRIARRPTDWKRTYGFERFQILVAFANGLTLFFIIVWIAYEAVQRFFQPVEVMGGTLLVIAGLGLIVNLLAFWILHGGDRDNLNMRGASLHVLGDLLGSVAALIAGAVILLTGWTPIDPLLSLLVALILLRSAWGLVTEAGHILLEGTPAELDVRAIGPDLTAALSDVEQVHHVHAWSLTQQKKLVTLHARVQPGTQLGQVTAQIKARLREQFDVQHATIELEHDRCSDDPLHCNGADEV